MKRFALLLALGAAACAQDVSLRAGVARVEITPGNLMQMYGYANRKCGPANGTHDPLYAKALVLASGDTKMAIVTLDLGSIVSKTLYRDVADKLGIEALLLSASHSHSGPAFIPYTGEPAADQAAYHRELEGKIFHAVEEASRSMFPASLGVGRGMMQLGYNRLLLRDDGRARAVFDNLERIPYGPVDPEFTLLRVDDGAGNARAMLVHYACHAVVLGPTSCKYSADYPGVLQARVEASMPGTQCMFVQGGAGDINPLFLGRTGREADDFGVMTKMGETLAAQVLRSAKEIRPAAATRGPIRFARSDLKFADRWDRSKSLDVGITTALIGREIAIAAVPGEPMHKLQKMWKAQADVPYPLFYGYTSSTSNDWPGYIPDLRSAAYGGYGADVTTKIEVGAGERILQQHLINLYQLLGMWRDQPGKP